MMQGQGRGQETEQCIYRYGGARQGEWPRAFRARLRSRGWGTFRTVKEHLALVLCERSGKTTPGLRHQVRNFQEMNPHASIIESHREKTTVWAEGYIAPFGGKREKFVAGSALHKRMVPSRLMVAICLPSGLNSASQMAAAWPLRLSALP